MTRFARAKGSKASNEKTPEDGTPWELMKEQLLKAKKENEEAKKRQEAENQRIENYENFLKEQKVQKRKASWCDFPETEQSKNKKNYIIKDSNHSPNSKKKKKQGPEFQKEGLETIESSHNKKKKKKKKKFVSNKINSVPEDDLKSGTGNDVKIVNREHKKKNKKKPELNDINTISEDFTLKSEDDIKYTHKESKKKNKRQKIKINKTLSTVEGNSEPEIINHDGNANIELKKKKKKPVSNKNNTVQDSSSKPETVNNEYYGDKRDNLHNKNALKKKKKMIDGKPIRRKAINDKSFQLIINGKDVELVRFDGFPIMKKDAERLEDLKRNMIKKGIPKSEVMRTIKLERRRAEKALARLKREVCYNCRKGGHNLSDCPDLKSKIPGVDEVAEGVCFKCGSTEHRQFECKVQRDKEFRFATCFICKEQGHIARQCPDNPKGLYPNGGCCKLCGDVTHLKKDCPTVQDKKEGSSIKLQTLDNAENIEAVDQPIKVSSNADVVKKPKKIKF